LLFLRDHSYAEAHLSTDNELVRDLLLALLSTLAKQESRRLSERVKAGMLRAKAEGKHIGRPRLFPGIVQQIRERIAAGESANAVARALGIDRRTVKKYTLRPPNRGAAEPSIAPCKRPGTIGQSSRG
jgi:DNA invertase Pin-like site-specific DNA recombinase